MASRGGAAERELVGCGVGAPSVAAGGPSQDLPLNKLGSIDHEIASNYVPLPGMTIVGLQAPALPADVQALTLEGVQQEEAADSAPSLLATQASMDEIDQYVYDAVDTAMEQEMENINQAVHDAVHLEMEQVNQSVIEAVENALLDRSFDVRANFNTLIALTGVILYWRGMWNLFDNWLGTESFNANLGSVLIGLSVMLLFRIFKLPLAEFW